ncbi:sensor histidine kinase [Oleiagrimonas sp. C23AA]|uniref:sensor histidine kinase n=1 Tax=Oleiagrimonas sp. C23AA TaxID=2719047 RepID=UPI0014227AB6|nr:sensor histidine kinase [Oleiagrimonas sp. C23AA]NII11673.1 sensor histidine kinase [Oleiagrimonas sp. C23AA]
MPWSQFNHLRLLRYAGLFTYVCVGMPLVTTWADHRLNLLHRPNMALLWWVAYYLLFGVLYWLLTRNLGSRRYWMLKLIGLAAMTMASIAVGWYSHSGLSAMLMVVVAVVLPLLVPFWIGVAWMVVQNLSLVMVFFTFPEYGHSLTLAFVQSFIYLGSSALTFVAAWVASQQAEERERQRQLNSELRATRALLAESSRIAERMRIARDLHDLVGHHLTALSLNLEVASHLVTSPAAEHVGMARKTAKHLLADVREVVSELRQDEELDLTQALRSLIEGVPSLHVHLKLPPRFAIEDPQRAQVVLRCVQEIVTNAVRHAHARNLWLTFSIDDGGVLGIDAHDDGRGARDLRPGNGLTGMRERLAEFGGSLELITGKSRGFHLRLNMPLEAATSRSGAVRSLAAGAGEGASGVGDAPMPDAGA